MGPTEWHELFGRCWQHGLSHRQVQNMCALCSILPTRHCSTKARAGASHKLLLARSRILSLQVKRAILWTARDAEVRCTRPGSVCQCVLHSLGMRCRHVCLLVWLHFLCLRSVGGSRLADLLTQRDAGTAMKVLKKVHQEAKGGHMATVHEVKMLDRRCGLAFGVGLARFVPSYFASGVSCLRPGCLKADGLAPWADRPLLRVVADREKAGNAAQGYLCSRLRALEVSDPFHILWRIALNAIKEAGCQGFPTTCSTRACRCSMKETRHEQSRVSSERHHRQQQWQHPFMQVWLLC